MQIALKLTGAPSVKARIRKTENPGGWVGERYIDYHIGNGTRLLLWAATLRIALTYGLRTHVIKNVIGENLMALHTHA